MRRRGFSLAESLLALAILALVLVMALAILHFSLYSDRRNEFTTRAQFLAQEQLVQPSSLPPGYTSSVQRQPVEDGVEAVTVTVTGPDQARATLRTWVRNPARDVILSVRSEGHWRLARTSEEGGPRQLLPTTGGDDTEPTVSPDGTLVVFASSLGGLWSMPTDGSAAPRRMEGPPDDASAPSYGPQLAYVAPDEEARSQLFLGDRQVSHGDSSVSCPSWGPHGQLVVALDSSTVALMAPSGAVTPVVEGDGWNSSPALSPDGQWVAFMSNRDGNNEIYRVRGDGSQLERLTRDASSDGLPSWSNDGRRLLFQSDRGGVQRIWSMNSDGSDVRRLGRPQDEETPPGLEPEGKGVFVKAI